MINTHKNEMMLIVRKPQLALEPETVPELTFGAVGGAGA